jgi:sulfite exporter TauE/SafE
LESGVDHLSMFLLGLLGSGHCIGMCGPLIIALPGRYGRWSAHIIYHLGRLLTYSAVGALMGGVNQGLVRLAGGAPQAALAWTTRMQIAISAFAAICLLLMGLGRIGLIREPAWMAKASPQRIPGYQALMRRTLDRRNALWLFGMGLMLGLLPCGLSYGAFSRCLAAESFITGAALAGSFGLGTLPSLLLLGTGLTRLLRRYQIQTELIAGLVMIGMAVALFADAWTALA